MDKALPLYYRGKKVMAIIALSLPSKAKIEGSNPSGPAYLIFGLIG
jgi:hypothetical protein